MKTMQRVGAIFLFAVVLLCYSGQDGYAATPTFSGLWNTDHGELRIEVAGNRLTGLFPLSLRRLEGVVTGMNSGGTWSDPPTYRPPHDSGKFATVLSSNGKQFSGKVFDSNGRIIGAINGERLVEPTIDLSRTWTTSVGDVALKRTGTQLSGFHYGLQAVISGSIDADGKIAFSVIKGGKTLAKVIGSFVGTGKVFKGWWSEPPTFTPPDEAGRVVFEFAADGSFSGTIFNGQDKVGVTLSGKQK